MIKIGIVKSKDCEDILKILNNILFFSVIDNIKIFLIDKEVNIYDLDIIIINDKICNLLTMIYLENIKNNTIVLLNIDNNIYFPKFSNKVRIVTYGFNSRACLTASSLSQKSILFCIQRNIPTLYGETLEPEEVFFDINEKTEKLYNLLPSIGALAISGLNFKNIYF